MTIVKDPAYNDALYGDNGTRALCEGCKQPADYLLSVGDPIDWPDAQAWCLLCRPRRGRPPHHGERAVRAYLASVTCDQCSSPATHAVTAPTDPPLSQLRRGKCAEHVTQILARAAVYCASHVPTSALGAQHAAAAHPYADPDKLRAALQDPRATSMGAVARLLGVVDGGTTTRSLLRNHAAHVAADPTFPALPQPRTQAEWGALAWADRD